MPLSDKFVMITIIEAWIFYVGEWHENIHGFTRNQVGRVALEEL